MTNITIYANIEYCRQLKCLNLRKKVPTQPRRNIVEKIIKKRQNRKVVRRLVESVKKEIHQAIACALLMSIALSLFLSFCYFLAVGVQHSNHLVSKERATSSIIGEFMCLPLRIIAFPVKLVALPFTFIDKKLEAQRPAITDEYLYQSGAPAQLPSVIMNMESIEKTWVNSRAFAQSQPKK